MEIYSNYFHHLWTLKGCCTENIKCFHYSHQHTSIELQCIKQTGVFWYCKCLNEWTRHSDVMFPNYKSKSLIKMSAKVTVFLFNSRKQLKWKSVECWSWKFSTRINVAVGNLPSIHLSVHSEKSWKENREMTKKLRNTGGCNANFQSLIYLFSFRVLVDYYSVSFVVSSCRKEAKRSKWC